jgi:GH18 family chitinase
LALDRLPREEVLAEARRAARRHGTRLMVSFGGNGRSAGFARMTSSADTLSAFVANVVDLHASHGLDGVDINWCAHSRCQAEGMRR